ncbi:MAG: SUMF1/EgtB/PvdO family nonheme iron enzyme [Candidatus Hydrogenedentes bacterium]|nr:SUMF1/EgtB/PvdO family nonheme iron enzyme [Candidatus Hydrogenedentota bacterium]
MSLNFQMLSRKHILWVASPTVVFGIVTVSVACILYLRAQPSDTLTSVLWFFDPEWLDVSPYTVRSAENQPVSELADRIRRPPPKDIGSFIRIGGGTLQFGMTADVPDYDLVASHYQNSIPARLERVSDFEIGKYEVTAQEFADFLNEIAGSGREPSSIQDVIVLDSSATIESVGDRFQPRKGYESAPGQIGTVTIYCKFPRGDGHRGAGHPGSSTQAPPLPYLAKM